MPWQEGLAERQPVRVGAAGRIVHLIVRSASPRDRIEDHLATGSDEAGFWPVTAVAVADGEGLEIGAGFDPGAQFLQPRRQQERDSILKATARSSLS